jgi:hypothetical protein
MNEHIVRWRQAVGLGAATSAFVLFASCGARPPVSAVPFVAEPGLANTRALNPEPSEDLGHDAISDGPESCPRSGRAEDDPLKGRPTTCNEVSPSEPPPSFTDSRRSIPGVSLFRSACDGNVHAFSATPFEFVKRIDGQIYRRTLTASASDETRMAEAGPREIACLQLDR